MPPQGELVSINISPARGTEKRPVREAVVDALGIRGDAHAGDWHRQVSLLAYESIEAFGKEAEQSFAEGDFAENLTVRGLDLAGVRPGDRIAAGSALLEVTQIGKRCHGHGCAVFRRVGRCVMPREGIFCRVLRPGAIRVGDQVALERCEVAAASAR